MMSNGERRSVRLVELESRAESKGTVICYAEEDVSSEEDDSCQKRRKKRVESRPVQDLAASRNELPLKTEEPDMAESVSATFNEWRNSSPTAENQGT